MLIIKGIYYKTKKMKGVNPKYISWLKREGLDVDLPGNGESIIPID